MEVIDEMFKNREHNGKCLLIVSNMHYKYSLTWR